MKNNIFSIFTSRPAVFDGAMGTMLQNVSLGAGEPPEVLNFREPLKVRAVHEAYINAGADVITTNSFGSNRIKLAESGLDAAETMKKAVAIAREAADNAGRRVLVAADVGPTGKLMRPLGELDFETARDAFAECAISASEAGADFLLFETMSDLYECKAAVIAARESCNLPVAVSVTFDGCGHMLTGADAECAAVYLSGLGVDAIGVNCGIGPDAMEFIARTICKYCDTPVFVNANAGMPVMIDGKTFYRETPRRFADFARTLVGFGVNAVGGCCGTTPEHISAIRSALDGEEISNREPELSPACCSGTRVYRFGKETAVIGERLNPTGKAALKNALREGDMSYVAAEASAQEAQGASLLDVNAGLPDIDESAVLPQMVEAVQSVTDLPLQLDSANPESLERAARIYNGIPVINSVSGKRDSLESVLPVIKKYGALAVALLLDENGIADDADGRLLVADEIIKTAEEAGISRRRLLCDALTMTIATDPKNGEKTLDCVKKLHDSGLMTVLGVSNISYGMPDRERINASFLGAAINRGLTAAIINPASDTAKLVIKDPSECKDFVYDPNEHENESTATNVACELTLFDAVFRGLAGESKRLAQSELDSGKKPMDIIETSLIPALNALGDGYERKEIFLPRLLGGADAAKAAFAVINQSSSDGGKKSGLTVVMATVKGDIHDIGKNIVVTLLKNYGFTVIDLGKDVPPERVLESARESGAKLVGLSALMTTTVPAMAETVELIHNELPGVRVMVGGAVLTQEYADAMHADFYGSDAMSAVKFAQSVDAVR